MTSAVGMRLAIDDSFDRYNVFDLDDIDDLDDNLGREDR
jgi:hypothetical protein